MFVRRYVESDDICESQEEKDLLTGALVGAILWGYKVDSDVVAYKIYLDNLGVSFKAGNSQ